LTSLGDFLSIEGNGAMVNLTGLENVTNIIGGLHIDDNDALTSLAGLEGLIAIEGELLIGYSHPHGGETGNPALTSLTGLCNLNSIRLWLNIEGNTALTSLTGLNNLTSIGYDLSIWSNDSLASLTGLDNLTSIGGNLSVGGNYVLASLTGLENLTSIGGYLDIRDNVVLTGLTGLDNIAAASISGLYIYYNPLLSACEVQSICDYLAAPNGIVEIYNNDEGCNSPEEVEAACIVGIINPVIQNSRFKILNYPNPFSNSTTLEYELEHPAKVNLSIFNHLGQEVAILMTQDQKSQGNHQVNWNAEGLPPGIYFYRLTTGSQSSTGKMVVMR
jgi:hypothetical protein